MPTKTPTKAKATRSASATRAKKVAPARTTTPALYADGEDVLDRPLPWTEFQLLALTLIFEGRKTQAEAAKLVKTSPRTLARWIAHPDFQAALAAKRAALIEALDEVPYIRKERRLIALAQMAEHARIAYETTPWIEEERPTPDGPIINRIYNRDAFETFRGALDDIAKELGARKQVTEIGGRVDVRQQVTFYMPQPESAPADVALPVTVDADLAPMLGMAMEAAPDEDDA